MEVSLKARKALLCTCIVLNCITAGSYLTFPLYGPVLTRRMNLSMSETNIVLLGAICGQYLSALFYGSIADYSSRLSSLSAAILYGVGYSVVATSPSLFLVVAAFALVGTATVGTYFAALTASAKSFPLHPGLAIGIPSALFGLSPLLLSSIGSTFFVDSVGDIDAVKLFTFFAIVLSLVNLFSAAALKPIIPDLNDVKEFGDSDDEDAIPPSPTEDDPLLSASTILQPHTDLRFFIKQKSVWIFLSIILLLNGPPEVISQNLGSMSEALTPMRPDTWPDHNTLSSRKRQIQIFSTVNTVARLLFGALSDYTCPTRYATASAMTLPTKRRWVTPRLTYLQIAAVLLALASGYTAIMVDDVDKLWLLSSCTGLSYGIVNVVGPSLVSKIWGEQDFGRNFGIIWSIAAIGPVFFGLLYGRVSDHFASRQHQDTCKGAACFQYTFIVIAAGSVLALVLIAVLKHRKSWRRV